MKITDLTPEQYSHIAKLAGLSDDMANLDYHGEQLLKTQLFSYRCNVRPVDWFKIFEYLKQINVQIPDSPSV